MQQSRYVPAGVITLPPKARRRILFYVAVLVSVLSFGSPSGGLIDIPISFFLKNKLQLDAQELALFRLVAAIPLCLSFVCGVFRDLDLFAWGDCGVLVFFCCLTSIFYGVFASSTPSYGVLLTGVLLVTTTHLLATAAQNGFTALLGKRYAISGQLSTVWNVFLIAPAAVAFVVGGAMSQRMEHATDEALQTIFLSGVAVMGVAAFWSVRISAWIPLDVDARRAGWADLKRLVLHWPVYPALIIWLMWNFAPGSLTPLQYYLQDVLKGDDLRWGLWNAIFTASFAPTFILFGLLCRHFSLRVLLIWGSVLAIPQMVPVMFIQSSTGALIAALPMGLLGGLATAAYTDLLIRSSPAKLEGTVMMLSSSIYFISSRFGDVLGAHIYTNYGGFGSCVTAIVIVYALIIPVIFLIPRSIIASSDI